MSEVREIKRYSNRKLYDLQESRYVTLQEVAEFLQNGDEIKIVDNKTREDITSVTLAQILYEQEKQNKSGLPLSTLKGFIRTGGEAIQKKIANNVHAIRDEAEKKMSSLREQARRMERMGLEARSRMSEATQTALDELSRAVDDRFKQLIGFPILSGMQKDAEPSLSERIESLESRLASAEARLKKLEEKK